MKLTQIIEFILLYLPGKRATPFCFRNENLLDGRVVPISGSFQQFLIFSHSINDWWYHVLGVFKTRRINCERFYVREYYEHTFYEKLIISTILERVAHAN